MEATTKTTRFLVISDTHDMSPSDVPLRKLPPVDVVLHCGNITENGDPDRLRKALDMTATKPAELRLVIPGNHDGTLDRRWFTSQGGNVTFCDRAANIIQQAKDVGVTVLAEGTHSFKLTSGASFTVYASPYSPTHGIGAFQYPTDEDRYNPIDDGNRPEEAIPAPILTEDKSSVIPNGVDIVMTHGPAKYVLDRPTGDSVAAAAGCPHLERAIRRTRPRLHAFGHVHCGYGIQRVQWNDDNNEMQLLSPEFVGKHSAAKKGYAALGRGSVEDFLDANRDGNCGQTLFVNAALTDSQGLPTNMPWVVELEL